MSRGDFDLQKLYKINQIACLFGISCDTLRLYEKIGILNPAYCDKDTKYRYYGLNEILTLDYIIQLKSIGLTLSDIKRVLSDGLDMSKKREILESRYNNLRELLSVYDGLMSNVFDIERKTHPAHYAVTKDVKASKWEDMIGLYEELTYQIITKKLTYKPFSNPYAVFDGDFNLGDFSCKICMEIEGENTTDAVFYPEQSFLCLKYMGKYEKLNTAYERLKKFAKLNKIELLSYAVERYIVAYDNSPMASGFITEVALPIASPHSYS
jgi:DNA-binding transcriptional MerR regulator